MKKVLKILVASGLFIFVAAQFYQPAVNKDEGQIYTTDFANVYNVPIDIKVMLQTSCYDCHSNNTNYVWFDYIQPARAFVDSHIGNGKKQLNFNEWASYSTRKQERLLNSIKKQIETKQMPLSSYLMLHNDAELNDEQINQLTNWLKEHE